ncbi:hypothetical protein ACOXXX_02335 [Thalassococcus sp. BH17M4-6]|uniref:hypothetical protein n=1 Tax=Thalassococcus sp. BH17M4-6 TaxID=3413148 RepID=UPI003BBF3B92
MTPSGPALRFGARLALVGIFVSSVLSTIAGDHIIGAAALCSLLTVVSLWLAFGVRTRVMALLGIALYIGLDGLVPGFENLSTYALIELVVAVSLALPLIAYGGGRYCTYRGGWQNVI